jgi:prepilin-type N-terminal cleavage/methylation domain-containing protein
MQRRGFTIIELMVVILLIGIITAMGLPRFLRSPTPLAQDFTQRLNVLMTEAIGQAQKEGEPRRIFFNLASGMVEMQTQSGKRLAGTVEIPAPIEIIEVVINGENQFQRGGGRTFYFLINAEGVCQEVLLSLEEKKLSATVLYTFYLNPFSGVFRLA